MFDYDNFTKELFFTTPKNFEAKALSLFEYQYRLNHTYRSFCDHLGKNPENTNNVAQVPFLPIEFFKWKEIRTGDWTPQKTFMSSGTTGQTRSKHLVRNLAFYHKVSKAIFERRYGKLDNWTIFALLPSYLEQGDSSLISMVDSFMQSSKPDSAYYLHHSNQLIGQLKQTKGPKLLIGVTYALLDLIESNHEIVADDLIIMETGGMKGRRREMIRSEVHELLKSKISVKSIHSEYGMCELTSQAYGENGHFQFPDWCKVLIRDSNDPLSALEHNETGGINVIDLANVDSCAFIATQDLGKRTKTGRFEVLGRFDNSDIRGCNLLV